MAWPDGDGAKPARRIDAALDLFWSQAMISAHDRSTPATAPSGAPTIRDNMETIARVLQLPLGAAGDAGLAFRIDDCVPATIVPGGHDRLVAMFWIAEAEQASPTLWISALSEAAGWGLDGERQRFVVVDGQFTLLWTTPPLAEPALLEQLYELFATAVALVDIGQRAGSGHASQQ
jgi:hypothetical protein